MMDHRQQRRLGNNATPRFLEIEAGNLFVRQPTEAVAQSEFHLLCSFCVVGCPSLELVSDMCPKGRHLVV